MKLIGLLFVASVAVYASMALDCAVFDGVWSAVAREAGPKAYECYAEPDGMLGFSKRLDSVWIIGSDKFYACTFRAPELDYFCVVDSKDTASVEPRHILDAYFNVKKNLQ
jgi:hypothetical protein